MPVRAVRAGADFVEIDTGGRIIRVTEADVAGADKDQMGPAIRDLLQERLATRTLVLDLSDDEPAKASDPKADFGERMFWEGQGGTKELVSRAVIVESVVWDGARYVPSLRRAR